MSRMLLIYRVLAYLVGILLLVATVALVFKYLTPDDSGIQRFGEKLSIVWLAHGWVYIVYLIVAFVLTQQARWSIPRFLLLLIAGLVPGLIFWVERRATQDLNAKLNLEEPIHNQNGDQA